MTSPYLLERPALVSVSGGRTSGYLLRHVLDAFGGRLPDDVHAVFFNTGKEMPETLEFVAQCAELWGVRITWLEYDPAAAGETREVTFATASRCGEPFEALIRRKRFLPNPVARICTENLKIKRGIAFMRDWCGYEEWSNAVGFRADEPARVARMRARNDAGKERFETVAPLARAGVTKGDVVRWWRRQPFDLALPSIDGHTPAGNCDLCFLKGKYTLVQLLREQPQRARWWIDMQRLVTGLSDKPDGARWRMDREDYEGLLALARSQVCLPFADADAMPCFCTD